MQKKRKRPGRPAFAPSDEQRRQVEAMVGFGLTYEEIASLIINPKTDNGISVVTLQKHFRRELQSGQAKVKAKVIGSLVKKACSDSHPGAVTAAIWITKARYGWRGTDKFVHEVDASCGVLVAPATMSPEEWIRQQQKKNAERRQPGSEQ